MGALCCVGRCFGCAGRAGLGWARIWHMSFLHVFMMSLCWFDLIDFPCTVWGLCWYHAWNPHVSTPWWLRSVLLTNTAQVRLGGASNGKVWMAAWMARKIIFSATFKWDMLVPWRVGYYMVLLCNLLNRDDKPIKWDCPKRDGMGNANGFTHL